MKKVLVGMSGGVDSSVTAAILLKQGYDVTGATMYLHPSANLDNTVNDAKKVCDHLGINHVVLDFQDEFKKYIVSNFVSEYKRGATPNPCILCNEKIKFGAMLDYAIDKGFDYIATGHYANVIYDKKINKYKLCASPKNKDQSYFLYRLKQNQLKYILLPLTEYNKDEVRKIARDEGLPVAEKKDSQEICFIPNDDYRDFLVKNGAEFKSGNFIDNNGKILGKHKGIINYTIGQRKGLGISFSSPLFVTKIDSNNNQITLGANEDLFQTTLICNGLSLSYIDEIKEPIDVMAKIRFRLTASKAKIIPIDKTSCKVVFDEPQRAITSGQSVVFYQENAVLGGGFIV